MIQRLSLLSEKTSRLLEDGLHEILRWVAVEQDKQP